LAKHPNKLLARLASFFQNRLNETFLKLQARQFKKIPWQLAGAAFEQTAPLQFGEPGVIAFSAPWRQRFEPRYRNVPVKNQDRLTVSHFFDQFTQVSLCLRYARCRHKTRMI
jgi:hypothetical protein